MNNADRILLQAAIDGEMDAPAFAAFERRLAMEPDLAAEYESLRALRGALRALPAQRAPDSLRAGLGDLTAAPAAPRQRKPFDAWRQMAASVAIFAIGISVGWRIAPRHSDFEREVLAGHLRGLMSSHPVDVISTDQHTVKPWFAGKLAIAPLVPDLTGHGYVLEGGRIDVIAGQPVPTLVYHAGKHLISVTRMPGGASGISAGETMREIEGHAVISWKLNGVQYVAVSDAAQPEVSAFVADFDAATEVLE
jgi:anti-sigma factor RsiW